MLGDPPDGWERLVYERPRTRPQSIDIHLHQFPNRHAYEEWLTIPWFSYRGDAKPDTIPQDAWDAILYNLRASYGDLWADYVGEMAENATYLGSIGQTTSDLGALWGFEVAQASAALSPVRYLAGLGRCVGRGAGASPGLQPGLWAGPRLPVPGGHAGARLDP